MDMRGVQIGVSVLLSSVSLLSSIVLSTRVPKGLGEAIIFLGVRGNGSCVKLTYYFVRY